MPVRKIKKNYRNVTGVSAASKAVGAAEFESTLERDFLRLLEFSPEVTRFEVQPVTITWPDDSGGKRSYTPDIWVAFHDGIGRKPWLCEVKYRADLKKYWPELRPKFGRAIRFARQRGWRFRLMTEVEIRGPELEAAKFLLPFRRLSISSERSAHVLAIVKGVKETTPDELLSRLSPDPFIQAEWLPVIWQLVATFQIGADMQSPLSMSSRLWSQE